MEAVLAEIRAARAEAERRASQLPEGSAERRDFRAWANQLSRLERDMLATADLSPDAARALFSNLEPLRST